MAQKLNVGPIFQEKTKAKKKGCKGSSLMMMTHKLTAYHWSYKICSLKSCPQMHKDITTAVARWRQPAGLAVVAVTVRCSVLSYHSADHLKYALILNICTQNRSLDSKRLLYKTLKLCIWLFVVCGLWTLYLSESWWLTLFRQWMHSKWKLKF